MDRNGLLQLCRSRESSLRKSISKPAHVLLPFRVARPARICLELVPRISLCNYVGQRERKAPTATACVSSVLSARTTPWAAGHSTTNLHYWSLQPKIEWWVYYNTFEVCCCRNAGLISSWLIILCGAAAQASHSMSSSRKTHSATATYLFTVEVARMWFVEAVSRPSLIIGYGEAPETIAASTNIFLEVAEILEPSQQISFKKTVGKPKPLLLLSFGITPIRFIRSRHYTPFQKHTPFQTYT